MSIEIELHPWDAVGERKSTESKKDKEPSKMVPSS